MDQASVLSNAAASLLVLTNDLHQQVFSFPSGVLSDQEYRYEGGYFFVLGWVALCAGFALLSMVKNCRIPRSRRIRWLPLVPLALSLVYACMYIKRSIGSGFSRVI